MVKDVTFMGKRVTSVGLKKTTKQTELKKHAATIHCSNVLSLLQRKISNALLYHAYDEMMESEEHLITVKQLCRLIGYNGNNHSVIKDALKGLISTVIEWNLIDGSTGNENWTASSIIASVSLNGPNCYYAYSPRMKQLLHSPSMFGKIDLIIQSQFRSSYGLALYENCVRYKGLPYTKWFDMDIFKKLMGIPEDKYTIFRDFKRRVLDKAIEEVNMYSDLFAELEMQREGRKVSRLRFHLKERTKRIRLGLQEDNLFASNKTDQLRAQLIAQFNLSVEQIDLLLREYREVYIEEKMEVILQSQAYQSGTIQNLTAYLMSALKHNYQVNEKKTTRRKKLTLEKETEVSHYKKMADDIRNQYLIEREEAIHKAIDQLPLPEKEHFMERFYLYAEPAIQTILQLQRDRYTRETILESPHIRAQLRQYALRELSNIRLVTIDEYIMGLDQPMQKAWQHVKIHEPDYFAIAFPA